MKDNMTKSEQLKWVLAESGRQIAAILPATWEFIVESVNAPFELAHEIEYRLGVRKLRNERIRNLLDNLTDETLLDRIIGTTEIPVQGNDSPERVPVRVITRRLKLIQDIR